MGEPTNLPASPPLSRNSLLIMQHSYCQAIA